ncbi:glutathione S-transferase [Mycena amicta]|nr:glutathione S-transferase [Mycena amicta]
MVVKLYAKASISAGGGVVALVLMEKQIPFQHIVVDSDGYKEAAHLARNPYGQVPVIEDDDGFFVYETRAICRYLAEKYPDKGPKLLPGPMASIQERAIFEQAASVEVTTFFPLVTKLGWEILRKPRSGLQTDTAAVETLLAEFATKMDVYDQILSKQEYIAGNEITLVDLFHLIVMPAFRIEGTPGIMTDESRPNVIRWWKAVTSRPEWVKLREEGFKSTA